MTTEKKIPVLTDIITTPGGPPAAPVMVTDDQVHELQARIATEGYALMERLLHESLREMEANLFADVIGRLRTELPNLINDVIQEHFGQDQGKRPGAGSGRR